MKIEPRFAYIDGANLHQGIKSLKWRLDYGRFRVWLKEKYGVDQAFIFIGLISKYKDLYTNLQQSGFIIVYKEVIYAKGGKPKGNCDADLVVKAMRDSYEIQNHHSILVTSDGDYAPLVKFWLERKVLDIILSPAPVEKCSVLLKRTNAPIAYLGDHRSILENQNEKAPDTDVTV